MEEEMFVPSQNASWSLVTHPPRKTTVGCCWVLWSTWWWFYWAFEGSLGCQRV